MAGEVVAAGVPVDAGAVRTPQAQSGSGIGSRSGVRLTKRRSASSTIHSHDLADPLSGYGDVAHLPLRLGVHVPRLPGRPMRLPARAARAAPWPAPTRWTPDPGRARPGAVRRRPSGRPPPASRARPSPRCDQVCPLLGLRPRLVLGLAGLQVRLLCQRHRLDRRRRPPLRLRELRAPAHAAAARCRPRRDDHRSHSVGVDADDLAHRPLVLRYAGPRREPDAEQRGQVVLQCGVVGLRGGDDVLVQHRP